MIYTTVNVTVGDYASTCDKKITLYRGDKNVEIRFIIKGNKFKILDDTYAQMIIKRPSSSSVFSEPALIQNDTVVFLITEDMIDEFKEIGAYTFQIRLYDTNMTARATLPPCESALMIANPIANEGETAVNIAMVNDGIVMFDDSSTPEEEVFTEDNKYNRTLWKDGDLITDKRLNKIEDALYYINENGGNGGGGGATAPYISTELPETVMVGTDDDFDLHLFFNSPNMGKGTLRVFINDADTMSVKIDQGDTVTTIPNDHFIKGTNRVVIYVLDRVGVMSNSLVFYIRYGSTEIVSDFDQYSAYEYNATIRYYFTPSALDTSLSLTFYMSIDGDVQQGVGCTSDTRGYYTFPSNLTPGNHYCEAYIIDSNNIKSNVLVFDLIILDETSLVVATDTKEATIEEGDQLVLDYKVYMKNNNSFITKTYIDETLINTGVCGLDFNYYRTSSLTEGEHTIKIEVWDSTETYSDYVIWPITVTASTFQMLQAVNAGATFIATAVNKSNTDERRNEFIGANQDGEEIVGTLYNFTFNGDNGWVDDELIISGNSHIEIPIQPLADNARYGFTLDIEFTSRQIGVPDAEVLTLWNEETNCGIKITSEKLILRSASGNQCDLYFTDNERTHVMFIIDRQEMKAKIYINGVMCEAFHLSDYAVDGVWYLEDFTVNSNLILGGLNKSGYSKIRNLRVYEVALTTSEIINNFIACKISKNEQRELVEFQKGNELPTLYIYCDFSGLGKDDKKPCKIVYNSTDEEKYGKSFNLDHKKSTCQYQGTSSMAYPIKNYRINPVDENGKKWKYAFPGGQPESRFTLKADFMSSGHWTNTGMAKFINDCLYNYDTTNEKSMNPFKWHHIQNGGNIKDFREAINGFPCRLILVNDGETPLNAGQNEPTPGNTKDMGVFNFNHDKDATTTLGFNSDIFPYCASYEVTANSDTSAGAFMSYKGDGDELSYIKESFELRYPDEDDVPEGWGFMGVGEEGTGLKALIDWVDGCTDEEFVADFEKHFHKDYTLRYFCLVTLIGAVDNLGKNMMLDTADNKIFFPRFYDIDTICSYDNSGQLKFDVDIEMEQGYWNTSSSRLWTRIRSLMHDDIVATYNNMRQNGVSYDNMMKYIYDEQIAKIPQTYYNKDYDIKYAPFADSYIGMAHGDTYEHVKRWLKQRFTFVDTLFDYAPSYNNDVLTIRANTTEEMTIEIETYTPVYQHLSWYNGQMDKKKIDGKISVTFSGRAQAATDQEVLIYGGSNIKCIRGISSMNPNRLLIGAATKLTELDVSNCTLLVDVNANQANFSPHSYLTKLNINGCTQLGGNLRMNNCELIQEIDASNTAITGVIFPKTTKNLKKMKFQNCNGLSTIDFNGVDTSNITNMDSMFLDCYSLTSLDLSGFNTSNTTNMRFMFGGCKNLTSLDLSGFDTSKVTDMSDIFTGCNSLTSLDLSGFDTSGVTNMTNMFYGCTSLTSLDLSSFNTSNVTSMGGIFTGCNSLTSLDLSGFDTSGVTNMTNMFYGCTSLTSLDLSGFDTSGVTNMGNMFFNCRSLTSLDLSGFNTSEVTSMGSMFSGCTSLTSLDLSGFDTSEVTNMGTMFGNCSSLTSLDVSGFNTPNVTSMGYMFTSCTQLTNLDLSSFDTSKVTSMYAMFDGCNSLTSLDLSGFDTSKVTNMGTMFAYCTGLTILDLSDFNTSNVIYMNGMFYNCAQLTSLDLSSFNTSNVTSMGSIFTGCNSLTSLDLSGFDTSGVTNMTNMFYGCTSLTSLDLSGFDTSGITNMGNMFFNCRSLTSLDLSGFNTSEVTSMGSMFSGCNKLTSLDLSGFDTSEVTNMGTMFAYCNSLKSLELSNFDTSKVTNMGGMFFGCNNLINLCLSGFDTSKVTAMTNMFNGCNSLTSLDLSSFDASKVTDMTAMFYGCEKLKNLNANNCSTDTLIDISAKLPTRAENALGYIGVTETSDELTASLSSKYWRTCNGLIVASYTASAEILPVFNDDYVITETIVESNANGKYSIVIAGNGDFTYCSFNGKADLLSVEYLKVTDKVNDMNNMFDNCRNLTSLDLSNFNTSEVTSMAYMFNGCNKLTSLDLSSFDTSKVTNMYAMFYGCSGLTSLDLSSFDTSEVTNMSNMFNGCNKLTSLDLSGFNTSEVTSMGSMFASCIKLTNLDLSGFDISKVSNMVYMFASCNSLTSLDLSGFDTSKVINMDGMFASCNSLTSLDVSGFNTSNVNTMNNMFRGCKNLTSLDLSGFDTSKVINMNNMFEYCDKLKIMNANNCSADTLLDISDQLPTRAEDSLGYIGVTETTDELTASLSAKCWKVGNGLIVASYTASNETTRPTFNSGYVYDVLDNKQVSDGKYSIILIGNGNFTSCSFIANADLLSVEYLKVTSNVTSMEGMFTSCTQLTSLDLSSFDTSNVTNMGNMFSGCNSLTSLDVSGFDTSEVTVMADMFNKCNSLTSLDLSGFDTSKVTSMFNMFYDCYSLTSLDVSGFNTSEVTSMDAMFAYCSKLTSLDVSGFDTSEVTSMTNMFNGCNNLTSLDLSSFDASKVTDMTAMFGNCSSLTSLDLSSFDTSKVTSMGYMFTSCTQLTNLDLSGFNTSEVTSMYAMFDGCNSLTSLDLSGFDTSKVINMAYVFANCTGLTILDVSGFDTPEVTSMEGIFYECRKLTNLDLSGFVNSKVTNMNRMFFNCSKLTSLDLSDFNTSNVIYMNGMFYNCAQLTSLDLSSFNTSNVTSMGSMFYSCSGLTNLDLSGFNTSEVTSMGSMFYNCTKLTSLDLSSFDTSKVTSMEGMFYSCGSLTSLDVSGFDTSKVTSMGSMFYSCSGLTNLDLSGFNTSEVTSMGSMFYNCTKLTSLDLSSFDTSKVTSMEGMFFNCRSLTSLDLSSFNTSNVTSMGGIFTGCNSLTSLDLSGFDTSGVTNMTNMFYGCTSLTSLDLSGFDTSGVTNMGNMFFNCRSLTSLDSMMNISVSLGLSYTILDTSSLLDVIDNLSTVTDTQTLTLGTILLAKLTEEQIAVATNKGWTVA